MAPLARFGDQGLRSTVAMAVLWAVVLGYVAFVFQEIAGGYANAALGKQPLYTDYTPTYGAALLVREAPAEYVYLRRTMTAAGSAAARAMYGNITSEQAHGVGFAPFMYPPTFIVLIAPLAYLPYLLSWFVWLGLTALPYLAAIRRILPGRLAWPFALAAPPVFFNVMYGQTGFLTAGLIGLGLTLLGSRPVLAGILIGLASVKPHFGILIPLALIAGGYWRTFVAATMTVLMTIVASVVAFGDEPWFAFIGTAMFTLESFSVGALSYAPMTTVVGTVQMAGGSLELAWYAQSISAGLVAALVFTVWRRGRSSPSTHGLQAAILCIGTPLALPMTYLYDLVLLVPGAAWLWGDFTARGAQWWERNVLLVSLASLLAVIVVANRIGIQIGVLCIVALFGLALWRFRAAIRGSGVGSAAS